VRDIEHIRGIIEEVKPDIVMLTGDIVDGRPFKALDWDALLEVFLDITKLIVKAGALWSFTPGNHDYDGSPWSHDDLLKLYKLPGCLSKDAKTFNHTLTVGYDAVPSVKNSLRLFLFDTGGNHPDPKLRYYTVESATVNAYKYASKAGDLNVEGGSPLGTAWYHIPLPECNRLLPIAGENRLFECALRAGRVPFPFMFQPFRLLIHLLGFDRVVGSSILNSGLFQAMVDAGNIQATFFGHDHHSDAVFLKDNIYMCYGRPGAHTPPSDWEGRAGDLPFDRHSARVCEFIVGSDSDDATLLTYIHERHDPRKDLVLMTTENTRKYTEYIVEAERARRCTFGFCMASVIVSAITVIVVVVALLTIYGDDSETHFSIDL